MKKFIVFLMSMAIAFALVSCSSSSQALIEQLDDLATELSEDSDGFSDEDWDKAMAKLSEIEENMQQYEYTDEELKEIGRLTAQCLKSFARSSATIMKGQLHNFQTLFEGAAEEFEGFGEEMESIFDGLFEE